MTSVLAYDTNYLLSDLLSQVGELFCGKPFEVRRAIYSF